MRPPLPYHPDIETPAPGEAAAEESLRRSMRSIQETTLADHGHPLRPVHAKSLGLLMGELEVLDGLPPEYAQGAFARPGRHQAILRLSTIPGDMLDDDVSSPRGLALKVLEVPGERLEEARDGATQDFVMANAPAFAAPGPEGFAGNLALLAATTDTGQGWKKAVSAVARAMQAAVGPSTTLSLLGGHPATHPLGETFHSQVPFRHGAYVAKYSLAPASPALRALAGREVPLDRPNALREAVIAFFADQEAEWELRVQLWRDAASMPIEDASVEWPEAESPHVPVARLRVPPQPAWSEARARQVDDGLAFAPWNGLAAHRPLGALNRARRRAYGEAAAWRGARAGCPMAEPRGGATLSAAPAQAYGTAPGREGMRPGTPDHPAGVLGQPVREEMRWALAGVTGGVVAVAAAGALARSGLPASRPWLALGAAALAGVAAQRLAEELARRV
ncbi:catalase family protein [Roseococcus sp. DSY-14]|uniref:catalase family protein n=1 Tax=Roseococcus sp. DSY-14 TaxID=3369650 RepID=UPI00387B3F46